MASDLLISMPFEKIRRRRDVDSLIANRFFR
jgi:hypothetical protein